MLFESQSKSKLSVKTDILILLNTKMHHTATVLYLKNVDWKYFITIDVQDLGFSFE